MRRGLGVALFGALGAHAYTKGWALLPEMLWVCHVASALLAVGLLVGIRRWVAVGFLLHVAVGAPSFLLDLFAGAHPTPTSWVVHMLPLAAGAYALRPEGLPERTWLPAWAAFVATFVVSVLFTPKALNVNLVHGAWEPLTGLIPAPWPVRLLNAGGALLCLFIGEHLLRRVWPRVAGTQLPAPSGKGTG